MLVQRLSTINKNRYYHHRASQRRTNVRTNLKSKSAKAANDDNANDAVDYGDDDHDHDQRLPPVEPVGTRFK